MKRSIATWLTIVFWVLWLGVAVAACGGEGQPTEAPAPASPTATRDINAQALVETRCTQCHTLDRITQARQTRAEWQVTVEQMRARGARLDAAEAEAVVAYLAQAYGR